MHEKLINTNGGTLVVLDRFQNKKNALGVEEIRLRETLMLSFYVRKENVTLGNHLRI